MRETDSTQRYKMSFHSQNNITGADLSYALSSFKRIKDLYKAERTLTREKQKYIEILEQSNQQQSKAIKAIKAINNNNDTSHPTPTAPGPTASHDLHIKSLRHTITTLHEKNNAQAFNHNTQLLAQREENHKLLDHMRLLKEELITMTMHNTLLEEKNKRGMLDMKALQQKVTDAQAECQTMYTKAIDFQHECNEVREAHKALLIDTTHSLNEQALLKAQLEQEQARLLRLLKQQQPPRTLDGSRSLRNGTNVVTAATVAKDTPQEDTTTEDRLVDLDKTETIQNLFLLLREERERLKELALELAQEKMKNQRLQHEIEVSWQASTKNGHHPVTTPTAPMVPARRLVTAGTPPRAALPTRATTSTPTSTPTSAPTSTPTSTPTSQTTPKTTHTSEAAIKKELIHEQVELWKSNMNVSWENTSWANSSVGAANGAANSFSRQAEISFWNFFLGGVVQ